MASARVAGHLRDGGGQLFDGFANAGFEALAGRIPLRREAGLVGLADFASTAASSSAISARSCATSACVGRLPCPAAAGAGETVCAARHGRDFRLASCQDPRQHIRRRRRG